MQRRSKLGTEHTKASLELLSINTSSALRKAESDHGCRYSVLMKLPYFDAPRMLIIDPMHNSFLGSAKHFLKGLIQRDLISESQFDLIQNRIDNFVVPSDTGRIPHKIRSGFSSFTADQWKNWTVYFSLIALRDILPSEEFECWRHFVLACRLLSCKVLSTQQMQLGDALLLQFCRRTQRLFGQDFITPNMHMHCHLRACIIDYGPLHGFWLYAFERYNGILGSMPTNNRSIEIQLMARFIRESQVLSASLPELFRDDFSPLFPETKVSGSVSDTSSSAVDAALALSPDSAYELPLYIYDNISFTKHCSRHVLTVTQKHHLVELYTELYSISRSALENGKQLGTHGSRSTSSSIVMAKWKIELFGSHTLNITNRAARVDYFCKHIVNIQGVSRTIVLVSLSWFKHHPKIAIFGKPITAWYNDLFEADGIHSLIPIEFIVCRCVALLDGESVLYVSPCIDF